jgi:hypothetical protein
MATKRKIYLPSIANLGPGSVAGTQGLVDLPLYYDYHSIGFEYTDVYSGGNGTPPIDILALLGDLQFKVNAVVKRIQSASDLDHANALNNTAGVTIYTRQQINQGATTNGAIMRQTLKLYFAEPWRTNPADQTRTVASLNPAFGVSSAQLLITLLANMPATGSLVIYAVVDTPTTTVPTSGFLTKQVLRQQIQASGAAIDINLPVITNGYLQTLLLKQPATSVIEKATFKVNGTIFRELDREANISELTSLGMTPATSRAAGAFGFDFVLDDDDPINSAVPLANSLQLHLDFTAGTAATGNIVAVVEYVQFGW